MRREAEAAYPAECCGLLLGREEQITAVIPAANLRACEGNDMFEVDPQVRFEVERGARAGGDRLIGHYHSHPDHPAQPSATDRAMAFEPNLIWLIVPVAGGSAGEPRAFRLCGEDVEELVVEIFPE
ncbi:MAG: hypothetical protein A2516_07735 [Alphaproteobacteria bacterium RIFOXYD12_FULL_60_8]|nr:MAG: hypothetical protein A2516_07735 [Alphaproteobacteria bacterium RIFOXYD12_FULL_60_8]